MVLRIHSIAFGLLALVCLLGGDRLPAQTPTPTSTPTCPALSDEDIWAFVVYLYGYDDEEQAALAKLTPAQRATFIENVRQMSQKMNVKNPSEFTQEEQVYFATMRDTFRRSKIDLRSALEWGNKMNQAVAEKIVALSVPLIREFRRNRDQANMVYDRYSPEFPIPEGWAFMHPLRVRVAKNATEIQLYTNIYKPDGPQVRIYVLADDENDSYLVQYENNLDQRKSWRVAAPKTQIKSTYGPVQNRH